MIKTIASLLKGTSSKEKHPLDRYAKMKLKVFAFSSTFTVFMVALVGGAGYFLDKQLGTYPKLFTIGLVLAYPIIQISLYKKYRPKRHHEHS